MDLCSKRMQTFENALSLFWKSTSSFSRFALRPKTSNYTEFHIRNVNLFPS